MGPPVLQYDLGRDRKCLAGQQQPYSFYIVCTLVQMHLNLTLWWRDDFYNAAVELDYLAVFLSDIENKCLHYFHIGEIREYFSFYISVFRVTFLVRKYPSLCVLSNYFHLLPAPAYSFLAKDSPFPLASSLLYHSQHNCASICHAGFNM